MMSWKYKLRIKDLLDQDAADDDVHARTIGPQVAERLMTFTLRLAKHGDDDLISEIADLADEIKDVEDSAHFNEVLSGLYDFGDAYRVWID